MYLFYTQILSSSLMRAHTIIHLLVWHSPYFMGVSVNLMDHYYSSEAVIRWAVYSSPRAAMDHLLFACPNGVCHMWPSALRAQLENESDWSPPNLLAARSLLQNNSIKESPLINFTPQLSETMEFLKILTEACHYFWVLSRSDTIISSGAFPKPLHHVIQTIAGSCLST